MKLEDQQNIRGRHPSCKLNESGGLEHEKQPESCTHLMGHRECEPKFAANNFNIQDCDSVRCSIELKPQWHFVDLQASLISMQMGAEKKEKVGTLVGTLFCLGAGKRRGWGWGVITQNFHKLFFVILVTFWGNDLNSIKYVAFECAIESTLSNFVPKIMCGTRLKLFPSLLGARQVAEIRSINTGKHPANKCAFDSSGQDGAFYSIPAQYGKQLVNCCMSGLNVLGGENLGSKWALLDPPCPI
eukprot:1158146-Pelagomonas_calceolata.AAC.7